MNGVNANQRPYAATANVISVIERARTRNLPEAVTNDFLRLAGISDNVFGRVQQALKFLGLVYEDGRPTEMLESIAGASDTEYKQMLAGAIRQAYAEDFERIDPAMDAQGKVVDAFKRYEPRSQTARMVMLFLGLCREAGIPLLDAPRERKMASSSRRAPKPKTGGNNAIRQRESQNGHSGGMDTGTRFMLTDDDIAVLDEDEFNEVWSALGKVARARARKKVAVTMMPDDGGDDEDA
jgi:Family of unknown function (DUF5343)